MLGIFQNAAATIFARVFTLGFHIRIANGNRAHLILADAARENFRFSRGGVKKPLTILFHQWNGKRPTVRADFQRDVGIGIGDQLRLLRQMLDKHFEAFSGLNRVGRNQFASFRPENGVQRIGVMIRRRRDKRMNGFLR